MNEVRLTDISNILVEYSLGNFKKKIPVSDHLDEIDSIITGINMLGEELQETTISKNFFENIYHSVTDILFVLDENGIIIDLNNYALKKLKPIELGTTNIFSICTMESFPDSLFDLTGNKNNEFDICFICNEDHN